VNGEAAATELLIAHGADIEVTGRVSQRMADHRGNAVLVGEAPHLVESTPGISHGMLGERRALRLLASKTWTCVQVAILERLDMYMSRQPLFKGYILQLQLL
jgi:hypothetical protein